jgi:hypothetical protein
MSNQEVKMECLDFKNFVSCTFWEVKRNYSIRPCRRPFISAIWQDKTKSAEISNKRMLSVFKKKLVKLGGIDDSVVFLYIRHGQLFLVWGPNYHSVFEPRAGPNY